MIEKCVNLDRAEMNITYIFCIQFISCVILFLAPAALNPGDVNGVGGGRHDIKMFQ